MFLSHFANCSAIYPKKETTNISPFWTTNQTFVLFFLYLLHEPFFINFYSIRGGGFAVRDQLTVRCYDRVGRWNTLPTDITDIEVWIPDFNGALTQPSLTGSMGWLKTTRAGWSPSMRTREAGWGRRTRAQGINVACFSCVNEIGNTSGLASQTCYSLTFPPALWWKEWSWPTSLRTRRRASAGGCKQPYLVSNEFPGFWRGVGMAAWWSQI